MVTIIIIMLSTIQVKFLYTEFLRVQLITNTPVVEKLSSSLTFKYLLLIVNIVINIVYVVNHQYNWLAWRH